MKICTLLFALIAFAGFVYAQDVTIEVHAVTAQGIGKAIGTITATDTKWGVMLKPNLSDLPPGLHGLHLHENGSCDAAQKEGKMAAAQAAGGHFDPDKSGKHNGPYAVGHHGDLPALYVDSDGKATLPVLAPRLKMTDLKGHAFVIHEHGDNYSDSPGPLGGGGGRIACGVAK